MIDSDLPKSLKDLKGRLGLGIDLVLPGVDILSTFPGGGYAVGTGTSMASPHATGLVALYIAQNGRATNAAGVYAIREALINQGVRQDSVNGFAVQNDKDHPENLGWAVPVQTVTGIASVTSPSSGVVAASSASGGSLAAAWAPGVNVVPGGALVPPVPDELGLGFSMTLNDLARKRIIGSRRRR
jgi:subtilisin family serine protease